MLTKCNYESYTVKVKGEGSFGYGAYSSASRAAQEKSKLHSTIAQVIGHASGEKDAILKTYNKGKPA